MNKVTQTGIYLFTDGVVAAHLFRLRAGDAGNGSYGRLQSLSGALEAILRSGSWMTMTKTLDVNKTSRNNLHFEPTTSGWSKDFHGAFLFKKVSGDFPATARLKVSGKTGELPTALWSLVVLMVREARPQINKDNWQPRGEN